MNKVINGYLISGFLKTVGNVTLVFVCLGVILNLFEEIEFFKNLDVGISLPFLLTLMFIPNLIIKLLPFIIFIASMWYLISIKSNKDLLSLKVFGFSNLKIILMLSSTSFILGLLVIFAINPVTSVMIKYYEKTKSNYSKDIDHLVSINKNGLWIKEISDKNLRITTAKAFEGPFLNNVTIYEIGQENKIIRRIESKQVNIIDNTWKFNNATIYLFDQESEATTVSDFELNSIYNFQKLNSLYKNLDTISFYQLTNKYEDLTRKGYSKELLNEKINIFLSLPVFLFLMVVLASIFSIGSIHKSQNIYYIFVSIISCVIIYYFKDLSIALGQTNRISLTMAVWMPVVAIGLFCSIGVLQINEK